MKKLLSISLLASAVALSTNVASADSFGKFSKGSSQSAQVRSDNSRQVGVLGGVAGFSAVASCYHWYQPYKTTVVGEKNINAREFYETYVVALYNQFDLNSEAWAQESGRNNIDVFWVDHEGLAHAASLDIQKKKITIESKKISKNKKESVERVYKKLSEKQRAVVNKLNPMMLVSGYLTNTEQAYNVQMSTTENQPDIKDILSNLDQWIAGFSAAIDVSEDQLPVEIENTSQQGFDYAYAESGDYAAIANVSIVIGGYINWGVEPMGQANAMYKELTERFNELDDEQLEAARLYGNDDTRQQQ